MECRHCGSPVARLDDVCSACGKRTGQRMPWYVYGLGAVLALLLFLSLSDFQGLARFVANLGRLFRQ
jgi:hypothetical protein